MKTVLITGAFSGIGAEVANLFSKKGYEVIYHDRINLLAGSNQISFDLMSTEEIKIAINKNEIIKNKGVDILINNAGGSLAKKDLVELEDKDIIEDYKLNVLGHVNIVKEILPYMNKPGCIINTTSIRGDFRDASSGSMVYSMHKAAMNSFTVSLAKRLAPDIRVNAVAPGHTLTEFSKKHWSKGTEEKSISKSLSDRIANPYDIAKAFLFITESDHINGQIIRIDGGYGLA
ncbi:MAG: SDR family oxidoreductase [Candidatus Dojkabacteria bacterium]|nr:SDR family oxidoreductase [Candidatus Dojkabacteria bacterium]MDQ7021559.1 SDR family oxidoreductase [Candidatus Dojkabacteria bacterium]